MIAEIQKITVEQELKKDYLDYAMSVIAGRALPDVRDGLKPVHRRILFAMLGLGNTPDKPYKKSARIVGDTIGKYHPHGDNAVYDAIVRMAQDFSMRYLLVDGQGNFGSVDGDPPAAMRYTEIRMTKISSALLDELSQDTVDFVDNYDGSEEMPELLPAKFPNLLVNGSSGIAVGMATNIPPHNLYEICSACQLLLKNPEAELSDLMQCIAGPDFPTKGIINGKAGILEAYKTGKGRVTVRAKAEIIDDDSIIISELPYQVNKARLIENIAELVKNKKLEGISALRDESDKDGMRIVIELKRGTNAEVILNKLYTNTQLQTVFGINMVGLIDGRPKTFTLKGLLEAFLGHRRRVVTRRTLFELNKARSKIHVLEGLAIALANLDEVIKVIKGSNNVVEAKQILLSNSWNLADVADLLSLIPEDVSTKPDKLLSSYGITENGKQYILSDVQVQAILDLRLYRLTGLEKTKIIDEYKELLQRIQYLSAILASKDRLLNIVHEELEDIKNEFGDERLTYINEDYTDINVEDLIPAQDVVVTLSYRGYIKHQTLDVYQAQRRGGKGKAAVRVGDADFVNKLVVANTHDTLLCFSNLGKVYWLKVYQTPQASRINSGRPIINMLPLAKSEFINNLLPFSSDDLKLTNSFIFMTTAKGYVKKVAFNSFWRPRNNGLIAIFLEEGDQLIGAGLTDGNNDIMLFSKNGKAIKFHEKDVRSVGRVARGSCGMKLRNNDHLISLMIIDNENNDAKIFTATSNGFGKRTDVANFNRQHRGGLGVVANLTNEKIGNLIGVLQTHSDNDHMMLISDQGALIRINIDEVPVVGRATKGVKLINLKQNEHLSQIAAIAEANINSDLNDDLNDEDDSVTGAAEEENNIATDSSSDES